MRRKAKVDANQRAIVDALRKAGCAVRSTAQLGKGFPDLCISKAGHCCLAEVKDGSKPPSERKLTPDQIQFMAEWKSSVFVLSSIDDAIRLANAMGGVG